MKSATQPTKKAHHVVPQFHLRYFANGERIWTYDKKTGKVRNSTVTATGFETHLYSVAGESGNYDTDFEDAIAAIESSAVGPYEKLVAGEPLDQDERRDFAAFLGIGYLRSSAQRRLFAEMMIQMLMIENLMVARSDAQFDAMVRDFEQRHGPMTAEEKAHFREGLLDPSQYTYSVDRAWTLQTFESHPGISAAFFGMEWSVVEVPGRVALITSDNPIVVGNFTAPVVQSGLLHPEVCATMPLTPGFCWMGHHKRELQPRFGFDERQAGDLNRLRAMFAERFLFASSEDEAVAGIAREYAKTRLRMQFSGYGSKTRPEVKLHRSKPSSKPPAES